MLNITSVGHNDTGNYTCEASNVVGSARMTRELIVEGERVYKVLGKTGKGCYRIITYLLRPRETVSFVAPRPPLRSRRSRGHKLTALPRSQ